MYFPKNQIITDLYSDGRTLVFANSSEDFYTGYYFQTSDGKIYTGRNPNDKPNNELRVFIEGPSGDAEEDGIGSLTDEVNEYTLPIDYLRVKNIGPTETPPYRPIQTIVQPTKKQYEVGEFERYFTSKVNEILFTEINHQTYKKFKEFSFEVDFRLYFPFSLPWVISGNRNDAYNINRNTVNRTSQRFGLRGFDSYFKNRYDQYYRYKEGSNLITDGTEFKTKKDNKIYTGAYHVHPTKGPMVGAEHVPYAHDFLIPISGSNIQGIANKIETQRSPMESRGSSGGY